MITSLSTDDEVPGSIMDSADYFFKREQFFSALIPGVSVFRRSFSMFSPMLSETPALC